MKENRQKKKYKKITDKYIEEVDELTKKKEEELMEV